MDSPTTEEIILGIDPGTQIMGYGVIRTQGKKPEVVALGVVEINKYEDHYQKLSIIFEKVNSLIEQYHPSVVAIEAPFFGKNIQSMLKLGRAQGAAIIAAMQHKIPLVEYAPRKIKLSIAGKGNASKEEVARMLEYQLKFKLDEKYFDASDGLATALCHFYQKSQPASGKGASTWSEFIKKNPSRVKPG